jgi:hypothetical protein
MKGRVVPADREETDNSPTEHERLWTRQEVADYLGVAFRTTYNMLGLPAIYITERTVRFEPASVKRWAAEHTRGAPALTQRGG